MCGRGRSETAGRVLGGGLKVAVRDLPVDDIVTSRAGLALGDEVEPGCKDTRIG